jgi:hypothetical protein
MSTTAEAVLAEIDEVLDHASEILGLFNSTRQTETPKLTQAITRLLATIDRLTPDPSEYRRRAHSAAYEMYAPYFGA